MEMGSFEMKTSMTGLQVSPWGAVVDNVNAGDRCVCERLSRTRRRLVRSEAVVGDAGSLLVLRSAQESLRGPVAVYGRCPGCLRWSSGWPVSSG